MDDNRDFKTQPQQWNTIVDFGEEHPTIFRPQFKHGDGDARHNAKLWEELAEKLNSMGFGFRSVDKWKMAIGRWKSKTKSKAAQLRIEAQKTGGGPSNALPLTETEERLMNLMGWRSVTGDGNAELGMGPLRPIAAHLPLPQPQPFTGQHIRLQPPKPQPSTSVETVGSALPKSPPPLASCSGPARKRSRLSTEKSRKFVSLSKMHQEAMEERKKLRKIVRGQAEAQQAMARTLKNFFAYYKMKDNN